MKQLMMILCLLCVFSTDSLARSKDKGKEKSGKCSKLEVKSWSELEKSKHVTITEQDSSITLTSGCDLRLHAHFNYQSSKDLIINAKSLELKNHSTLQATRMILNIEEKLETKKHSKLCAQVLVLEAGHAKLKGNICSQANVLGSAVNKVSALAILKVSVPEINEVPAQVSFDWSESFGLFDSATLDLGDGQTQTINEKTFLKTYEQAGEFSSFVTLHTQGGDVTSNIESFTLVEKENHPPVLGGLNLHHHPDALAPLLVQAELWPHYDNDGQVTAFEVDWGNGSSQIENVHQINHLFHNSGNYVVRARVQDNNGAWSNWVSTNLTVKENQAPIIAHVPIHGNPNMPVPITLGFAPHEGTIDDQYVARWTYDFGDGSPVVDTVEGHVNHEFLYAGNFNVVITAYDPYGLSSSYTIQLELKENQPPVLSNFNISFPDDNNSKLVEFDTSSFASDSDGYIQSITYQIEGGDSFTTGNNPYQVVLAAGDYIVTAIARDDRGATASVSKAFTVLESYIPVVDFKVASENLYAPVTLAFEGRNLVTDRDNNILGYSWEIEGQLIQTPEAFLEWTFTTVGIKTITLTVVDGGGNQVSAAKSIEILSNRPPIANFELEEETIDIFEVIGFDGASLSSDPEGRLLSYEWFVNNELISNEAIFAHYFEVPGEKIIQLKVTDDNAHFATKEHVLNVFDSGNLHVIPVIKAYNENGIIEETLYLSAEDSNFNQQEISSIKWTINDSYVYEGLVTSYTPEVYGEVKVSLEITSTLGLSKEVIQYFNVTQRELSPQEIESPYVATISGIEEDRLHGLSEQIIISLNNGTFNNEQSGGYLRVNGEEVSFNNLTTQISANLALQDGINLIEYEFFDENSNFIRDELSVYAGSGNLTINLYDLASNLVNENDIDVFVSLARRQSVTKRFSVSGPSFEIQGLPIGQELVLSLGGKSFVFGDRYTLANASEVKDLYVATGLPLTTSNSLALDQNFNDWTVENISFDANQGRFVLPSGGYALLKRRVEITNDQPALNASFDLRFTNDKEYAVYTIKNITSGYLASFSRSIRDSNDSPVENQEFNTALSTSLGIKSGDVVEIEARFYRPEDQTSFISKIFNVWAQDSSSSLDFDLDSNTSAPLLHFDLYEFNPLLDEDKYPRKFHRLNAFSISQIIGGYEKDSNKIFVRARFNDTYVVSTDTYPLITVYLYGLKMSSAQDRSYYSVRTDVSNPINCTSEAESPLLKCNGSNEEVLLRDLTQTDFNLRNFNGHTDMNLDVVYSLNTPLNVDVPVGNCDGGVVRCQSVVSKQNEGGPFKILRRYRSNVHRFIDNHNSYSGGESGLRYNDERDPLEGLDDWMTLRFEEVLRYLLNSNRGIKFNDTSNVNGGAFPPHGGHGNGQEVDIMLRNHIKGSFREEDFYEIYDLFKNPIMDRTSVSSPAIGSTYGIFATFGDEQQTLKIKRFIGNRCLGVRSAARYIRDYPDHESHLHISTRDDGAEKFTGAQRRAFDQSIQDTLQDLENSFSIDAEKNIVYDLNLSGVVVDIVRVTYEPQSASDPREEKIYKHLFSSDKINTGASFAPGFEIDNSASEFTSGRYTRLVLKVNPSLAEPANSVQSEIEFRVHRLTTNVCYSTSFNLPPPCLNPDNSPQTGSHHEYGAFVSDTATVSPDAMLGENVAVCDNAQVEGDAVIFGNVTLKENVVVKSCGVTIFGPESEGEELVIQGNVSIGSDTCPNQTTVHSNGVDIIGNNISIGADVFLSNTKIEGDNVSLSGESHAAGIYNTTFGRNVSVSGYTTIDGGSYSDAVINGSRVVTTYEEFTLHLYGAMMNGFGSKARASGIGLIYGSILNNGSYNGGGPLIPFSRAIPPRYIIPILSGSLNGASMSGNGYVGGDISNGTSLNLSSIGDTGYCEDNPSAYSTRESFIDVSINTGESYSGVLVINSATGGQFLSYRHPCDFDPIRFYP